MATERLKRMQYLTVNVEDYVRPRHFVPKRLTRSATPTPRGSVSFEDGSVPGLMLPDLRKAASTRSLHTFERYSSSESSPNSSLKMHKSTESLCFGRAKKKLHRQAYINDDIFRMRSYTDPDTKLMRKPWKLPIISIPETDVYTITPSAPIPPTRRRSTADGSRALGSLIEQTLKVTTASMGLQTGSIERLTQLSTKPLSKDVKQKFSRSQSLMDKNNQLRPNTLATSSTSLGEEDKSVGVAKEKATKSPDMKDLGNFESLMLDQEPTSPKKNKTNKTKDKDREKEKDKVKSKDKKEEKEKENEKQKQKEKEKKEKSKKGIKNDSKKDVKKLQKAKSASDAEVDLGDDDESLLQLLRRPSVILENEVSHGSARQHDHEEHDPQQRPKSMPTSVSSSVSLPTAVTARMPTAGKKDDASGSRAPSTKSSSAAFKRDSFIRQSLQSLRRSFGASSKKYVASTVSSGSSTSHTSSASSASSSATSMGNGAVGGEGDTASVNIFDSCLSNDDGDTVDSAVHYRKKPVRRIESAGIIIMLNDVAASPPTPPTSAYPDDIDNSCFDFRPKDGAESGTSSLRVLNRSTSSVSALAYTTNNETTSSMAPLQSHAEAHSVTTLNSTEALEPDSSGTVAQQQRQQPAEQSEQQEQQKKRTFHQQISTSGASTQSGYSSANSSFNESYQNLSTLCNNQKSEARSLKTQSSVTLNPLASVASSASLRSISPSGRSFSSNGSNTAKHEQQSTAAATAAAAGNSTTPPEKEKEKKRKEMSSSRVKKFHRHFSQVSKDEKLINYFSCALVSDILLQGHLYITDQHFAFYSNVFGYVTKVVIPTSSVTKISKEKTAKIIPNAVGVATADERHVFGSFISREAAFRLMCSVCPPLAPAEILPKAPADIEISEEYSIEDDSSCSISGNESPPRLLDAAAIAAGAGEDSQTLLRRSNASSSLNIADGKRPANEKQRHSDIPINAKTNSSTSTQLHMSVGARASAPAAAHLSPNNIHVSIVGTRSTNSPAIVANSLPMIIAGTASTTTTSASSSPNQSSSSSPTTVMATKPKSVAQAATDSFKSLSKQAKLYLKFPTELNVVYLGVLLSLLLTFFSIFLLFRILNIEAKTSLYNSPGDFNWRAANDDDIFAEALRWQKELQTKSTEEAQSILNTNLEQIAKVRRSLETLSMLINDRSTAYASVPHDDSD